MEQSLSPIVDNPGSIASIELTARPALIAETRASDTHTTNPILTSDWAQPSVCLICNLHLRSNSRYQLHPCGHLFCSNCLTEYLELRVNERGAGTMGCPAFRCSTKMMDSEVEALVSRITFAKYLRFRLQNELEADPTLRWCPRPGCEGYDHAKGLSRKLTCQVCGFLFCRFCLSEWHGRRRCKLEIDRQFEKWARGARVKFCPQCRMRVEKNLGCPHMTCQHCNYEWCWACGAAYAGHYRCPVRNPHWANQHWSRCFFLLGLPILCLLAFVIGTLYHFRGVLASPLYNRILRYSLFLLLLLLSIVLTPIFYGVLLPISGVLFLLYCYKECECCGSCFMKVVAMVITLPLGLALSPAVLSVVLTLVMLGPPIGLVALVLKLGVCAIRCFKKDFMKIKSTPGYPQG